MVSKAWVTWISERALKLDEIESAHRRVGGSGRGRRYATQQINQAYAVMLSSQFQGFCRDLHTEAIDHIVDGASPSNLRAGLRTLLVTGRKLDTGNPNPGHLGHDFNRLGMAFWDGVKIHPPFRPKSKTHLEDLNEWRNAIAHQNFDPQKLGGGTTLHLKRVRQWRSSLDDLASTFDFVVAQHVGWVLGKVPW